MQDFSLNAAPVARRVISIVCPGSEKYCINPDTAAATCTSNGVCGQPTALSSLGTLSTSSSTKNGTTSAAVTTPTAPVLTLQGPAHQEVAAGAVYDRCAANAPMAAVCDRGAAAYDANDKALDRFVMLCGNR